ncbi:hypothetical protein [Streptomyces sp. NPDC056628]|uniref:VMAP-C domain-containing protein n=1 Tax=Streptomyces sp. NPDC056628 TaxID=3345882 RepID=UPI003688C4F8
MTDSAATPPTAGLAGRTVGDLQRAIAHHLAHNALLSSETGWRALTARLSRTHGSLLVEADASTPPISRVQRILEVCASQPDSAEALADALDHATGDPEISLSLRTIADWLAARDWLTATELDELSNLVKDIPAHQAAAAAQACLPTLSADLPRHCIGTWPTTLHLLRRNMLPSGLPPLLAFVEYLAAVDGPHQPALHAWADKKAAHWELTDELHACRQAAADFTPPAPSPTRVMFVFLPDGLQKDYYTLRMWHREGARATPALRDEDTQALSYSELARTVAQRLRQWMQETNDTTLNNLSIEFWLPLSLVNEPVWDWCKDATQATPSSRNVLIRSLDRLQIPTIQSAWRARWESLMQHKESTTPASRTTSAPHTDVAEREPSSASAGQDLVILDSPPNDRQGRRQLLAALRSGTPAILWHRQDCSPAFQSAALRLISAGPLHELPDRISELRAQERHSASADDAVKDITLLWDDPHHTLPTLHSLVAPSEARTS